MGLYRRKDSTTWWMCFSVEGKPYRKSTGTDDRKLAERIYAKVRHQVAEGQWFEEQRHYDCTFGELASRYKEWCFGRQRSVKNKFYLIDQLTRSHGELMLAAFNTLIVEQIQTNSIARGLKPASCNKIIQVIKHMFRKAVEWELVSEQTLKAVQRVKLLRDTGQRLRYLSKEECKSLISECNEYLKPIVVTALNTGMRRGELLSLKWENVDLKHGFLLLSDTKNGERREIPINRTLSELLRSMTRRLDVPYVFFDPATGNPYGEVKKSFAAALRRAGIVDFHFHDLRHTFASQLIMSGVDLTTVKELLGHKDIKMTLRYAHLAPSHKVKAMEIFDHAMNGKSACHEFITGSPEEGSRGSLELAICT